MSRASAVATRHNVRPRVGEIAGWPQSPWLWAFSLAFRCRGLCDCLGRKRGGRGGGRLVVCGHLQGRFGLIGGFHTFRGEDALGQQAHRLIATTAGAGASCPAGSPLASLLGRKCAHRQARLGNSPHSTAQHGHRQASPTAQKRPFEQLLTAKCPGQTATWLDDLAISWQGQQRCASRLIVAVSLVWDSLCEL